MLVIVPAAIYGVIRLAYRGESLGQAVADLGGGHIAVGAAHLPYNSNPPTSGPHHLEPATWGIYQKELSDEVLVHNLEHGGIWISYGDIDQPTKQKIETLAKQYPDKLIVTPRGNDDARIVLASWGRLLKLESFDEPTIIAFIRTNKNRAPEANVR